MTDTKPGKLLKQGPIATLEGSLSFSENDKFMFNGDQFVHYVAKPPKIVEASANTLSSLLNGYWSSTSFASFKNPSSEFRLTDGEPTYTSGIYTGVPTNTYDHVVIGYQIPVSTSQIKFWSEDYIPVEYIRVDYGYDSTDFINIPTYVGNVTYTFNDALKVYDSESTPQGQYIYTVDLGAEFTAKYWRIRSFIYSTATEALTAPVAGKDVDVTTVSGLPDTVASSGNFYFYANHTNSSFTYTPDFPLRDLVIDDDGSGNKIIRNAVISDGQTGTIKTSSFIQDSHSRRAYLTSEIVKSLATETLDLTVQGPWPATTPGSVALWALFDEGNYSYPYRLQLYYDDESRTTCSYVSLSGNTIETITFDDYDASDTLFPGGRFVYAYPMKVTQVQVQERVGPQLRYWESDGSLSVTNLVSISDIYDVIYDNSDDVYYAVRFAGGAGQGNPTISDNFTSGVGQYFDTNKWSLSGNVFNRDSSTDCLSFLTSSGTYYNGDLVSTSYFTGSFTADLNTVVTTFSGAGSFGLSLIDNVNDNQVGGVYAVGDWLTAPSSTVSGAGVVAVSTYDYVNSTDNVVTLADTMLDPYNILEGVNKHTFTYVTSSGWYYSRENRTNPGEYEVSFVFNSSSATVNGGGFSCSLEDSNVTVPEGGYVSFITEKATISGVSSHEVVLKTAYNEPTNIVDFSYNDGTDNVLLQSSFESSVTSNNFRVGIVGANTNYTTISASSIDTTGNMEWGLSCFEVVSMDVEGNRVFVDGVSDANGSVIKTLDIIEDPSKVYSDYYNTVSIATTNEGEGAGGSLFVRVGSDVYKYNKTTLPVLSPEKGSNAVVLASGISMKSGVRHFQYDGYSIGGLSYLYDDANRDGVFMSIMDAGTLAVSSSEAELDITSVASPLARDVSDTTVLYTVIDDNVYVFNASEDDVSFCNVVSDATLLPASSEFTTTVTALVTNMFGEPLSNKTVAFALTAGGGSISSASDCTTSSGTAVTTFTASSIEGTSLVTATASNDVC